MLHIITDNLGKKISGYAEILQIAVKEVNRLDRLSNAGIWRCCPEWLLHQGSLLAV